MLAVKEWVNQELIPCHLQQGVLINRPSILDRRYFPTVEDLRNMSRHAINKIRSRCTRNTPEIGTKTRQWLSVLFTKIQRKGWKQVSCYYCIHRHCHSKSKSCIIRGEDQQEAESISIAEPDLTLTQR